MTTSARTPQYVFAEKRCKYTTFLCRVDVVIDPYRVRF